MHCSLPFNPPFRLDPDYPLKQFYEPFKELKIRAYFFPMETRLDRNQLEKEVLPKIVPNALILSEFYKHDGGGKGFGNLKGVGGLVQQWFAI